MKPPGIVAEDGQRVERPGETAPGYEGYIFRCQWQDVRMGDVFPTTYAVRLVFLA